MNVLVLDDMQVRHAAFRRLYECHDVTCVFRYSEFLSHLNVKWDLVHLDHDLGDCTLSFSEEHDHNSACTTFAETYVDGWGKTQEYDGRHAARKLCQLSESLRPSSVIIHSVNPDGARAMLDMLNGAGIKVVWEPFGDVSEG